MTISRICHHSVLVAEPDDTVQAVGQRMAAHNVGMLVVVDQERRPMGIITDRDLALKVVAKGLSPSEVQVQAVMTTAPVTVPSQTSIEAAIGIMRDAKVRRLPVVGSELRLVGIVTIDDVVAHLTGELREIGQVLLHSTPDPAGASA